MSKYWIKAWVEILNDSKMAILPDRLWRRAIEVFLAAGHYDQDGKLPDTSQLAWLLRIPTDELEHDLRQLAAATGIVQRTETGWLVTKFAARQAPTPGAERIKQWRERQQKRQYYAPSNDVVTKSYAETETETEAETEADIDTAAAIASFNAIDDRKAERLYMHITGLTFIQRKDLADVTNAMLSVMDFYSGKEDKLIEEGKAMYAKWCSTTGQSGKPYSKLNPGWLSWWIEAINKAPGEIRQKDIASMTTEEFAAYVERMNA